MNTQVELKIALEGRGRHDGNREAQFVGNVPGLKCINLRHPAFHRLVHPILPCSYTLVAHNAKSAPVIYGKPARLSCVAKSGLLEMVEASDMTKEKKGKDAMDRQDDSLNGPEPVAQGREKEDSAEMGMRIKEARKSRGFSVFDVYLRTDIDVDLLSRIEEGKVIPPLGTVVKLAKALDLKVGYFISGKEGTDYTIVRREDRRPASRYDPEKERHHGYEYQSLAPRQTDSRMEPFLVTLKPSETEEERSTHDGQEFIFVLQGSMEVRLGEKIHILETGDSIYYKAAVPHLVKCHGKEITKILAVLYTGK